MTILDWIVIAGGLAAIAWVNWYFLLAGRRASDSRGDHRGETTHV